MSKKLDNVLQILPLIRDGERTWQDLANATGEDMGTDSVRRKYSVLYEFMNENYISASTDSSYRAIVETKSDGTTISDKLIQIALKDLKDPKYLMEAHGFDPTKWELRESRQSMWAEGKVSSRIAVRPLTVPTPESIIALLEGIPAPELWEVKPTKQSGQLLEIHIADLHLGKLGWGKEIGENYDEKIAQERFRYIIKDIIAQSSHLPIEKILFIWSHDFFHSDGISQATTAGTPQDMSIRWQKMFQLGTALLTETIANLATIAPVETFYVGGNHDHQISYYALCCLSAYFRDHPNVTIDLSPKARKFVRWGKTLLGYTHGEERKQLNSIMAREVPEMFGQTVYRYLHAGHYHSQIQNEADGCVVQFLGSPTGSDSWHYSKGFIGSQKLGYGFVYDKQLGQRLQINANIPS